MTLHRGKIARTPSITLIRPLTREDLAILREPRGPNPDTSGNGVVTRFRDPHHHVARLYAAGLRHEEVAFRSGYSYNRVSSLAATPAMQELIAKYREKVDAAYVRAQDDYNEILIANKMKSEVQISERLEAAEEEGVQLPIRDLIAISRDAADRTGHGKRQMNINLNVDYAAQLEKTIARSKSIIPQGVSPITERPLIAIEARAVDRPQPPMEAKQVPASQPEPPSGHPTLPLIRRRA